MIKTSTNDTWVHDVALTAPSLQDNTADAERLTDALAATLGVSHVELEFELLDDLPEQLRRWNYRARCICIGDHGRVRLVALCDPCSSKPPLGLAVDLGTTRLVLRLLDLAAGEPLEEIALDNPQIEVGPDILARIHFADTDGGAERLARLVVGGLNEAIGTLCSAQSRAPEDIFLVAVAGNTAMTHLLLGIEPRWLIREPYIPVANRPGLVRADRLGLCVSARALCYVFPNVGSYFGGDLLAGILFSGIAEAEQPTLLVDVGTNAEVVLGNRDWLIACAGAAGPALEGGVTKMGMMAGPGAIDRVTMDTDTCGLHLHTIDDEPPRGICGSGLIDLAAALFLSGRVDIRGKFVPERCGDQLRRVDEMDQLVLVPASESASGVDLTLGQADLDSLIRSKAAMYTILRTVTHYVGVGFEDLAAFFVAGTFGIYIDPRAAITIGMLPDLPLATYQPLGNSSLGGATVALTSRARFAQIDDLRDRITYLELNVNQEFMNRFSAAKFLPHTDPSRFPSVHVFEK
jgi:uncharacterized 2Fe-2S/4Fe-4S cluster protein (DUF4445 family)